MHANRETDDSRELDGWIPIGTDVGIDRQADTWIRLADCLLGRHAFAAPTET